MGLRAWATIDFAGKVSTPFTMRLLAANCLDITWGLTGVLLITERGGEWARLQRTVNHSMECASADGVTMAF